MLRRRTVRVRLRVRRVTVTGLPATIRAARPEDLAAVEALLKASALPTAGVASCIEDFLVAEANGDIVGAIGMEIQGRYGLLRSAVVADGWKGKGIGRTLVRDLLSAVRSREVVSVYLLTTTAENYFPAFGFERVSRDVVPSELMSSEEFNGACPDTAIVMGLSM